MKTSESISTIMPDLILAQADIKTVVKDQKATVITKKGGQFSYTYADLSSVIDAVKNILNQNRIGFFQPICGDMVETRLIHKSGEWISDEGVRILSEDPNNPQVQGSAITYARRYGLMSMLGIPAEDDDGKSAASPSVQKPQPTRPHYSNTARTVVDPTVSSKQCQMCGGVGKHVQGCPDNI